MSKSTTVLIGVGYMGREYYKVLREMNIPTVVLGRREKNAKEFEAMFGGPVYIGDCIENIKKMDEMPENAIVAVNVSNLALITKQLIEIGIKNILVEKPVAYTTEEVEELADLEKQYDAHVFVAYNRHFFASVKKAMEIISEDGGVMSFNFEFTEWSHVIEALEKDVKEKENWLFSNSTHPIDLAFFLGGRPKEMISYVRGGLAWHPNGSVYAGAGITEKDALFSYQANWESPGRWVVEVLTKHHRLYFKPMEQLQIQNIGSVKVEPVEIDNQLEIDFKHGLYEMLDAFFNNQADIRLLSIDEHKKNFPFYERIAGIKG